MSRMKEARPRVRGLIILNCNILLSSLKSKNWDQRLKKPTLWFLINISLHRLGLCCVCVQRVILGGQWGAVWCWHSLLSTFFPRIIIISITTWLSRMAIKLTSCEYWCIEFQSFLFANSRGALVRRRASRGDSNARVSCLSFCGLRADWTGHWV